MYDDRGIEADGIIQTSHPRKIWWDGESATGKKQEFGSVPRGCTI